MTRADSVIDRERPIISCRPDQSVQDAARLLAEKRIGAMPVIDDGRVVGIFSERDVLTCIAGMGEAGLTCDVASQMTSPAITIDPQTDSNEALSLMTRRRIRHLPVIENGQLVGFVSIGDLVKQRIELVESEARQMREYIRTA